MKIDDATLMAYADAELPPDARAQVEAAMAADPGIAAAVARHRALRGRVRGAHASALDEPVPERLAALLAPVAPLAASLRHSEASPRRGAARLRRSPAWLAMAASLLLGLLLAQWLPLPGSAPVGRDLLARGELARTLERRLSGEASAGAVAGLSFRAQDGRYCRTFRDPSMAGLACRDDGRWRIEVLAAADPRQAGALRTASSLPAAVLAEVDARLDGEPLDADAERAARDAGWR